MSDRYPIDSSPWGRLPPGTRLDDRYEVVRLLGEGGMAAVYLVRHVALHGLHALKVPDPALVADPEHRERFLSEGQIQAQLRHPNVVAVTEIVTRPVAGLVMEWVDGPDLGAHLAARGSPLPLSDALSLMLPVISAVGAAHARGVVHRDLKPGNILVGRDPTGQPFPKVADFGIARVLDGAALSTRKRRTRTGMRMGTCLYMSPEQLRGAPDLDGRTDIFALGAILFELLCGRPAFDGPTDYEVMRRIVEGDLEFPAAPRLSPLLVECLVTAMAPEPQDRFPDCASFAAALDRLVGSVEPGPRRASRAPAAPSPSAAPAASRPWTPPARRTPRPATPRSPPPPVRSVATPPMAADSSVAAPPPIDSCAACRWLGRCSLPPPAAGRPCETFAVRLW